MTRFCISAPLALWLFATAPAHAADAQTTSPIESRERTVDRLIELVGAGHDLRDSEFRDLLSEDNAARLLAAAQCDASPPQYDRNRASALVLWDCAGRADRRSAGAMLGLDQGRVTEIDVMSAVMVPTRGQ